MTRKAAFLILVLIAITTMWILEQKPTSQKEISTKPSPDSALSLPNAVRTSQSPQGEADKNSSSETMKSEATASEVGLAKIAASIVTPEQKIKLESYAKLKAKVFLKDDEKGTRAELLRNEEFLKSLESVLKSTELKSAEFETLQNAAIDLLLEAQLEAETDGSSKVASMALISVIQDAQIENDSLSSNEKKSLAGIKAEVLYKWTSQQPEINAQVPAWLPGPVSQQIWSNVQATQQQNRLESAAETSEPK